MKVTSNFLGITLDKSKFKVLFDSLKKYSKENNLQKIIEVQNQDNIHITLYYLDKDTDKSVLKQIKNDLSVLNKKNISITLKKVSFFKKENKNYLCYLYPNSIKELEKINLHLKQRYISNAIDNNYKYIPHITIFKILDFKTYKQHEKNILKIINTFLSKKDKTNLYQSFNLYSIDSTKSPEKQKIIA